MATPNKRRKAATSAKKRKRKVVVRESVKVRPKATKTDTLPNAPTRTTLPNNGVTFKIKVRRK